MRIGERPLKVRKKNANAHTSKIEQYVELIHSVLMMYAVIKAAELKSAMKIALSFSHTQQNGLKFDERNYQINIRWARSNNRQEAKREREKHEAREKNVHITNTNNINNVGDGNSDGDDGKTENPI